MARPTERFAPENLNPRLVDDDLEEAFTRLAGQLLNREYPGLHVYPTGGKDGGIDFIAQCPTGLLVGDFKCLSDDGYEAASRAWRDVEGRLRVHLATPTGPTIGQSQYAPWYSRDNPIRAYRFCTSSRLKNRGQDERLADEIRQFFAALVLAHAHLEHLRDIDVAIIDWNDFQALLALRPEIALRWFPQLRPRSIAVLDDTATTGTFRDYLLSRKLPYFSRREYQDRLNATAGHLDEDELVALIDYRATTGLVITGSGGIGKTRLSLELGRRAAAMGALVLRTVGRVEREDLERLADNLPHDFPLLILVEYVETQRDFEALVGTLNEIADQFELRAGWIATCRTSYYATVESITRHRRVDLSAQRSSDDPASEASFQAAVVRHILERGGVGVGEDALRVCRNLPVLAVFLAYLIERGRHPDLTELLGEQDFGSWVARRVQSSFAGRPVSRDLASLVAMLPLDLSATASFTQGEREVFDRLAADGWVEREASTEHASGEAWFAAHDVLVDQIVVSYLRTIPRTADSFVRDLLARAALLGTLDSVVFAMQRIQSETPDLPWRTLLSKSMAESPTAWRPHRMVILVSLLLTERDKLGLLGHDGVWTDAENDVDFQNRIGWLTRYVITAPVGEFDDAGRNVLRGWIGRVAPQVTSSNFALTWGLRFAPDLVRDAARDWILRNNWSFQTHYLLVAWLEAGLPPEDVRTVCERWLRRWGTSFHASFVYRAWLGAKGESDLVRPFIAEWLALHRLLPEAQFVYCAWLDAKGESDLVRPFIAEWLALHRLLPEAQFVYYAWLNAKGESDLVRPFIAEWLALHRLLPEAQFVYCAWLDAKGESDLVRPFIAEWLALHRLLPEASFVYRTWFEAKGESDLVRPFIAEWLALRRLLPEASFVYCAWLDAKGEIDLVRPFIAEWLPLHRLLPEAPFVYRAWLDAKGEVDLVRPFIAEWLALHRLLPEAQFVYRAWLDAKGEVDLVRPFIAEWLALHRLLPEAQFVYRAWLDAKGALEFVRKPIADWLTQNGHQNDIDHLLRAWLQAGGEFVFIREHVLEWVRAHGLEHDAVYLLKYVAKQRDLPRDVVLKVLAWCGDFAADVDAIWRLTTLTRNLSPDLSTEALQAAHSVLEPILANPRLSGLTRSQVTGLLGDLSRLEALRGGPASRGLLDLLLRWVNHAQSFASARSHGRHHQTREFLSVLMAAVEGAANRSGVAHLIGWVDAWEEQCRVDCSDLIARLPSATRETATDDDTFAELARRITVDPTDLEWWRSLAVTSDSTRGQNAAAAFVVEALQRNVRAAEGAFVFVSEVRSIDPEGACDVLETMIYLLPDDARYWNMLGVIRRDLGRFGESLEACLKATSLAPAESNYWYALGRTHEDMGHWGEAEVAFDEALRLRNGNYRKAAEARQRVRTRGGAERLELGP